MSQYRRVLFTFDHGQLVQVPESPYLWRVEAQRGTWPEVGPPQREYWCTAIAPRPLRQTWFAESELTPATAEEQGL